MTSIRRFLISTTAMVLAAAVYVVTHESWNVWLVGDDHRWATGAIVLLGIIVFAASAPPEGMPMRAFIVLAVIAVGLAVLAFASGTLTPLSLLVLTEIVVWAIPPVLDAWHTSHHPAPA